MNNKGLSPIIATVLLIAFAVALGAMIMNWSTDFQVTSCSGVELRIESQPGNPGFCFINDEVKFNVRNVGSVPLEGILLRTNVPVPSTSLDLGETIIKNVPFKQVNNVKIELIPQIMKESQVVSCTTEGIIKEVLVPCAQ